MAGGPINPYFYFGAIQHAVNGHETTEEVWNAVREQAEATGLDSPGINAAQVSKMRGEARALRTANTNLGNADPQWGLSASMIGRDPLGRPESERGALGQWAVRFNHQTVREGEVRNDWRTVMFRGALPPTVGDLYADVDFGAQNFASDYGDEHVGISDLTVMEM